MIFLHSSLKTQISHYIHIVSEFDSPISWLSILLTNLENWPINKDFTSTFVNKLKMHFHFISLVIKLCKCNP